MVFRPSKNYIQQSFVIIGNKKHNIVNFVKIYILT